MRASTASHVEADRAVSIFGQAYARGSNDRLGFTSRFVIVSLRSTGASTWARVDSC